MKTLNECPRRYVHHHVVGRGGWPGGPRQDDADVALAWRLGSRRPHSDLMMRAVSEGIRDRLWAEHQDEAWSEGAAEAVLRSRIDESIRTQDGCVDAMELDSLVEGGWERLRAIERAPLISLLGRGERIDEWTPLDRLDPLRQDGARLYAAPDLLARSGSTWHLVRISAQIGRREPLESQRLELGMLLAWALEQPGLAREPARFIIHRLGWRGHRWLSWRQRCSETWLRDSRALVEHDLAALSQARWKAGPFTELELLPTTDQKRICRGCGYREICPGAKRLLVLSDM